MERPLVSNLSIGEPVSIIINGQKLSGNVRTIIFSNFKVRYSVSIIIEEENGETARSTLHNIDSYFVKKRPEGVFVDFGEDNYS